VNSPFVVADALEGDLEEAISFELNCDLGHVLSLTLKHAAEAVTVGLKREYVD
jgi:hypothetical protein